MLIKNFAGARRESIKTSASSPVERCAASFMVLAARTSLLEGDISRENQRDRQYVNTDSRQTVLGVLCYCGELVRYGITGTL